MSKLTQKQQLVLKLENLIQVTKLQKEQLPNSDWDLDTKFKMDIFYAGKITAFEMVMNDVLNQIK